MGLSQGFLRHSFVFFSITLAFFTARPLRAELFAGVKALLGAAAIGLTHNDTSSDYPDLIGIDRGVTVRLAGETGHCTGTFISPTRVLTAAHCVDPKLASGGVNIDGIASVAAYAHPDFVQPEGEKGKEAELSAFDIAVVEFPSGTSEFLGIERFPAIAKKGFDKGVGYVGGYGMDDFLSFVADAENSGAGILGWGAVNILGRDKGVLKTDEEKIFRDRENQEKYERSTKIYSHCLPGDSGAAVYNEQGEIIAVVSALMFKADRDVLASFGPLVLVGNQRFVLSNYFIDITSASSQEVLNQTLVPDSSHDTVMLPVAFGSLRSEKAPFGNVLLRTGKYTDPQNKTFAVIPSYQKGKLDSVKLYEGKGRANRKFHRYQCAAEKCMRSDTKELLLAEQNTFTLFEVRDVKVKATAEDRFEVYELEYDLKETAKYQFVGR